MAINDDLYWYKNVLKRTISTTIRFYLSISIILSPIILMNEANASDDDWWTNRQIQLQQARENYAKRVYGRALRTFTEPNPATGKTRTVTKVVVAETVPTASRVGSTMMQRLAFYGKNPGVQMVGVMAVVQLIEAIGWVMQDGTYVKKKPGEPDPKKGRYIYTQTLFNITITEYSESSGASALCQLFKAQVTSIKFTGTYSSYQLDNPTNPSRLTVKCKVENGSDDTRSMNVVKNPAYSDAPPPETIIPLTAGLLGAAMMGEGYSDPVDSSLNSRVNTGEMDGSVAAAYIHDPTKIGDDLATEMDNKIKNAPPTPDGNPAPSGDPRYATPPSESSPNMNDRSWTYNSGTADGNSKPSTDNPNPNPDPSSPPDGGGQSISIEFPVFCEWAFKMCEWYDDWKKTDEWMKQDPDHSDPEEVEVNDDVKAEKVTLTGSNDCPKDSVQFTLMGRSYTIQLPYQPVCNALIFFKPAVLAVGAITSAFIVAGINVKGED